MSTPPIEQPSLDHPSFEQIVRPSSHRLTWFERLLRGLGVGCGLSLLGGAMVNAWAGGKLGHGCPLKHWIGIPCPTWGMTRAWVATLRGDVPTALHFHAWGPLLVLACIGAILHFGLELVRSRRLVLPYSPWLRSWKLWAALLVSYLFYHGLRLGSLAYSGELRQMMAQSVVGQWLHWSL